MQKGVCNWVVHWIWTQCFAVDVRWFLLAGRVTENLYWNHMLPSGVCSSEVCAVDCRGVRSTVTPTFCPLSNPRKRDCFQGAEKRSDRPLKQRSSCSFYCDFFLSNVVLYVICVKPWNVTFSLSHTTRCMLMRQADGFWWSDWAPCGLHILLSLLSYRAHFGSLMWRDRSRATEMLLKWSNGQTIIADLVFLLLTRIRRVSQSFL